MQKSVPKCSMIFTYLHISLRDSCLSLRPYSVLRGDEIDTANFLILSVRYSYRPEIVPKVIVFGTGS